MVAARVAVYGAAAFRTSAGNDPGPDAGVGRRVDGRRVDGHEWKKKLPRQGRLVKKRLREKERQSCAGSPSPLLPRERIMEFKK